MSDKVSKPHDYPQLCLGVGRVLGAERRVSTTLPCEGRQESQGESHSQTEHCGLDQRVQEERREGKGEGGEGQEKGTEGGPAG